MSSPLLDPFTIPAGDSKVLSLYLDGTDELLLLVSVSYGATDGGAGCALVLTNGYGSRDSMITYPYNQPIPCYLDDDGTSLTAVTWSGTTSPYALSAVASLAQSGDVWVDMRQTGDYLQVRINNGDAVNPATVTVRGKTS